MFTTFNKLRNSIKTAVRPKELQAEMKRTDPGFIHVTFLRRNNPWNEYYENWQIGTQHS